MHKKTIKASKKQYKVQNNKRKVRKINGKWTPAKLKGENVRSYFKFPISMMFE